jgi:hypothetical protein
MSFAKGKPSVVFVLDESGSMGQWRALMDQRLGRMYKAFDDHAIDANLGVVHFSTDITPIDWVYHRGLHAGGNTNLYGACVQTLHELRTKLTIMDKCLVIVITDGEHNAGNCAYAKEQVAAEVSLAEDSMGWDFLFVGTDLDAYHLGSELGIKPGKALSFATSQDGFEKMLDSLQSIISRWVAGQVQHDQDFFTQQDREAQSTLGARGTVIL